MKTSSDSIPGEYLDQRRQLRTTGMELDYYNRSRKTFRYYVVVLNIFIPYSPTYYSQMYVSTSSYDKTIYRNIVQDNRE